MTKTELERIIEGVVRKKVAEAVKSDAMKGIIKKYVQMYTPLIVREVVDDQLNESLAKLKKSTIKESFDTISFDSDDVHMMAARKPSTRSINGGKIFNTITAIPAGNESTMLVPVDQSKIPDYLLRALNKNYREDLKVLDEYKGAGAGSFIPPSMNEMITGDE